jgi:hypothetical protein
MARVWDVKVTASRGQRHGAVVAGCMSVTRHQGDTHRNHRREGCARQVDQVVAHRATRRQRDALRFSPPAATKCRARRR